MLWEGKHPMAIYLDELQVGTDASVIGFPHLLLCMGAVVLMADNSLIGAHFDASKKDPQLAETFREAIVSHGGKMKRMYVASNLKVHYQCGGTTPQNKAEMIGYKGKLFIFDCGLIKPKDGTFVEFLSLGMGVVETKFKRNEKMVYTTVFGPRPHAMTGSGAAREQIAYRTAATTKNTKGRQHSPTFHTVKHWTAIVDV